MAVSPTSKTLNVGETVQLTGTKNPSTASEGTQWTSSNTSVATVSNSGLVTAKAAGTATITFKNSASTKSATCSITVEKRYSSSEINSSFYGSLVSNYHGPNDGGMKYRIFYADGTNVYLIADDYIHRNYMAKYEDYRNIRYDYSPYFESGNNYGMGATQYWMLNKKAWAPNFVNDFADYAYGGATIDLWLSSYNQTHGTNISYSRGYNIRVAAYSILYSTNKEHYCDLPIVADFNGIYMKTDRSKAKYMVLSSECYSGKLISVGYCNAHCLSVSGGAGTQRNQTCYLFEIKYIFEKKYRWKL